MKSLGNNMVSMTIIHRYNLDRVSESVKLLYQSNCQFVPPIGAVLRIYELPLDIVKRFELDRDNPMFKVNSVEYVYMKKLGVLDEVIVYVSVV